MSNPVSDFQGVWSAAAIDLPAIADRVAARLGITVEDAARYLNMAAEYVAQDTGVPIMDFPPETSYPGALLGNGLELLTVRMYTDQANPSGAVNDFDPTFQGVFTPLHLYSHLDEYWRHLRVNHGVA